MFSPLSPWGLCLPDGRTSPMTESGSNWRIEFWRESAPVHLYTDSHWCSVERIKRHSCWLATQPVGPWKVNDSNYCLPLPEEHQGSVQSAAIRQVHGCWAFCLGTASPLGKSMLILTGGKKRYRTKQRQTGFLLPAHSRERQLAV